MSHSNSGKGSAVVASLSLAALACGSLFIASIAKADIDHTILIDDFSNDLSMAPNFDFSATPKNELCVSNQGTREDYRRKRFMSFIYLYYLIRFQTQTLFEFTLSTEGMALLEGLHRLQVIEKPDYLKGHGFARVNRERIRALAADPAQIFKTAPPVLAEISL